MTHRNTSMHGFTLVELSLAMTFISVLLIAISLLTLQISSIYNKGITLREVNQQGQLISSEIQQTIASANPDTVETALPAVAGNTTGNRLCVGNIVYVWNFGTELQNTANALNVIDGSADVRLSKFVSEGPTYCDLDDDGNLPDLPASNDLQIRALLSEGDRDLALHRFTLEDSGLLPGPQKIFKIAFILGTPFGGLIDAGGTTSCKPIKAVDDDYCAVNEFVFTARAGNIE